MSRGARSPTGILPVRVTAAPGPMVVTNAPEASGDFRMLVDTFFSMHGDRCVYSVPRFQPGSPRGGVQWKLNECVAILVNSDMCEIRKRFFSMHYRFYYKFSEMTCVDGGKKMFTLKAVW